MAVKRTWARKFGGVLTALAVTAGIGMVSAQSASAAVNYCTYRNDYPSTNDTAGGARDAIVYMYPCGQSVSSWHYKAFFDAYGELLTLTDRIADGYGVASDVRVLNSDGKVLDYDSLHHATDTKRFNLGTPDGSGDITEGLSVEFNVCAKGLKCSNLYAYGKA